jgi:hypothetical protein
LAQPLEGVTRLVQENLFPFPFIYLSRCERRKRKGKGKVNHWPWGRLTFPIFSFSLAIRGQDASDWLTDWDFTSLSKSQTSVNLTETIGKGEKNRNEICVLQISCSFFLSSSTWQWTRFLNVVTESNRVPGQCRQEKRRRHKTSLKTTERISYLSVLSLETQCDWKGEIWLIVIHKFVSYFQISLSPFYH